MKNKSSFMVLIAVFFLMLIFGSTAYSQTGGKRANCSQTTDAALARAINNRIKKVKAGNPRSNVSIKVRVKNRVVTLSTRTPKNRLHQNVIGYAKTLRCVRKVAVSSPGCSSPNCPAKFYLCGDQCIPCTQVCAP
jgi:hypothetical protein